MTEEEEKKRNTERKRLRKKQKVRKRERNVKLIEIWEGYGVGNRW